MPFFVALGALFMRVRIFFSMLLLLSFRVCAQQVLPQSWQDYLETCDAVSEADYSELEELFYRYTDAPINLNDTLSDNLSSLFFVTPFQVASLRAYIFQRGALLSINELYLVNGFDSVTVNMLRPVVSVEPPADSLRAITLGGLISEGRNTFLMGSSRTFEQSKGYRDGKYEGDPFRHYLFYRYKYYDRVFFQLSCDKDAGEALFAGSQQKGFDHYGFSLSVSPKRFVESVIVGNYNLRFGQGATMWTGFSPFRTWGSIGFRSSNGATAASPFSEYGYFRGAAASFSVAKPLKVTLFYGNTPLDATITSRLTDVLIDGFPAVQSISYSGLHRTQAEIAKKDKVREQVYGANISYRTDRFTVGVTGYGMLLDKFVSPAAYRYNYYYFSGRKNADFGIDAAYRWRNVISYGEFSLSQNGHRAVLFGVDMMRPCGNIYSFSFHDYDALYWNLHSAAISTGGYTRNERSASFNAKWVLPWKMRAYALANITHFPEMRSTAYGPSNVYDFRLRMERPIGLLWDMAMQYRFSSVGSNVREDKEYHIAQANKHQIQLDVRRSGVRCSYDFRFAHSFYQLEGQRHHGNMAFAGIHFTPFRQGVTVSLRAVYFDVDDYDARIYTAEHGLAFDNSGVAFLHQGVRLYCVLHYNISKWLLLGLKYSVTQYLDNTIYGSGLDALESTHRQQLRLQARLLF